ncbi:vitamin D3 hydroxylase-associated protein-like [Apteryx mantelli]|uniref:Vitamin D3 hydroxylase-associated protein-like n=1 Tax=Apteryx mantelli TaxID=2696672 RepID=A0ABM4EVZ8_9AVES
MICEKVKQLLSAFRDNPCSIPILVCSSTAALKALAWAVRKLMKRKFVRAKHHAEALEQMEKAVQQFKKENPDVQTSHILSLPLTELVEKLREGSLSPETILYSYIEKALEVNQEVNCVTAFIPSCLHHIQEMRNQKKGLLYGVPISIKDHVACKGYGCICGSGPKLSLLEQEESVLVRVLRSQGAIPFVKTNTAQCVINYDCSNAIYGQTLNPLNHKKSPGGCSGGEGALFAGGGSILGIGLDIGGSIRLLSSFCGLCGLKPTSDRLSYWGVSGPVHRLQTGESDSGSSKELADLHAAMMVYRWEFITRWKNLDLDVILCPVLGPAFTLGYLETNLDSLSSTMLYNILNFPAGVVSVALVTEADEEQLQLYSGYLDEPWDKKLRKAVEGAVGLPVAVQCVALPWQEELCLRFMKEVERLTCEKKWTTDASGANAAQRHGLNQTPPGAASVAQQSQKSSSTLPDVSSMTSKAEEGPTLQRTALQITIAEDL